MVSRLLSVAPMMDWTDRHYRYFARQISRHTLLYTEMVTTGAILHGNTHKLLAHHPEEYPLAVQLGGSNPTELAQCAKICTEYGYQEINLNVGCPSDRVQNGFFGACLMAKPELVAQCVSAMQAVTHLPITVKHRIGIDDLDSYEQLSYFVRTIAEAGCTTFIVHARKAWLTGLSPKENREIPPLRYDIVYQLKKDFPHLEIIINGGIKTMAEAKEHVQHVDGVMMGREAYQNPYILATADSEIFGSKEPIKSRLDILNAMQPYIAQQLKEDVYLSRITRHMLGLFQGKAGARAWKRHLSENSYKDGAELEVFLAAMAKVPEAVLQEKPLPESIFSPQP